MLCAELKISMLERADSADGSPLSGANLRYLRIHLKCVHTVIIFH
jgi:hypothetical protein